MRPWFEFDPMARGPSQGISSVLVNPSAHAQSSHTDYVSCFASSPPLSPGAESYFSAHRRGWHSPGPQRARHIASVFPVVFRGGAAAQEVPSRPICLQLLLCLLSQPGAFPLSQASCVPYTFKGPKALRRPSSCVWPVGSSSKPTWLPGPRFHLVKACQSLVAFWNRCRSHQNPTSFNFFSYLLVVL